MELFVQTVCAVAEVIFLSMVCDCLFARREEPGALSWALFGVGAAAAAVFPVPGLVRAAVWVVGGGWLVWRRYDVEPARAGAVCLALAAVCWLIDGIMRVLLSAFFGLELPAMERGGQAYVAYVIICHLFYLLGVVLVRMAEGITSGEPRAGVLLPACPTLATGILFCCLLASEVSGKTEIVALGLLYTSIVVMLFTGRMQQQETARRELEQANRHYAMQKAYYDQLLARQEQTRALWHDIQKYIRAAETEGAGGQSLEQLRQMADAVTPVVDVGNRVVSVILNEYAQAAREAGTALELDVQVPEELPVSAADLYILLGNTLDNALAACAGLAEGERRISLQMRTHNQMLFYKLVNPCRPGQTEARSGVHGYGLDNVRSCAKRHRGSVGAGEENGAFTVTVLLNC